MLKSRTAKTVLGVAVAVLAALGVTASLTHGHGGASGSAAATAPADPYAVYLATAPAGAVHLSREDAQTRALLGCGQTWAPGTVDAALAAAYRPTGLCGR